MLIVNDVLMYTLKRLNDSSKYIHTPCSVTNRKEVFGLIAPRSFSATARPLTGISAKKGELLVQTSL